MVYLLTWFDTDNKMIVHIFRRISLAWSLLHELSHHMLSSLCLIELSDPILSSELFFFCRRISLACIRRQRWDEGISRPRLSRFERWLGGGRRRRMLTVGRKLLLFEVFLLLTSNATFFFQPEVPPFRLLLGPLRLQRWERTSLVSDRLQ